MREQFLVAPAELLLLAKSRLSRWPGSDRVIIALFPHQQQTSETSPSFCGPLLGTGETCPGATGQKNKKTHSKKQNIPTKPIADPGPGAHTANGERLTAQRHAHTYPSWSRSCVVSFGPRGELLAHNEGGECLHNEDERLCARVSPPLLLCRAASGKRSRCGLRNRLRETWGTICAGG